MALYAKSKLVPLMPAGDISVGYYLYKSMKLFKADGTLVRAAF